MCSDNYDHERHKNRYVYLKCHDIARGNPNFAVGFNTNVRVHCPANCLQTLKNREQIWGTGPFKDDSQICLAALFAGAITETDGGFFFLSVVEG